MTLRNLGCLFKSVEKTKEIASQGRIICNGQGQFALWPCEPSGPLQDVVPQRLQFFKLPLLGEGEFLIHAQKIGSKKTGFIAASRGADFENDSGIVISVEC